MRAGLDGEYRRSWSYCTEILPFLSDHFWTRYLKYCQTSFMWGGLKVFLFFNKKYPILKTTTSCVWNVWKYCLLHHDTAIVVEYLIRTYNRRCRYIQANIWYVFQTSITCGGMKVYSSFNNPYPSSAQFQSVQNTLASNIANISETFFNITGNV